MKLKPSEALKGQVGIAGHAGIGHAFSHSGFFQEDSGGLAVLITLLERAWPMNMTIASVEPQQRRRSSSKDLWRRDRYGCCEIRLFPF